MNIDYEIVKTSTDKILSILRDMGNESIFQGDVDLTKDSLSDICLLGVKRINVTSSEVDFLGYHPAGEFVDDGTHGPKLSNNHKYVYVVCAYLTNPDQVSKSYQTSISQNKAIIKDVKQIRIPSYISKVQTASLNFTSFSPAPTVSSGLRLASPLLTATTFPLGATSTPRVETPTASLVKAIKLEKNFSPVSLKLGVIKRVDTDQQDYDIGKFNTGDTAFKKLSIEDNNFTILSNPTSGLTRSNMGAPVLRFDIT